MALISYYYGLRRSESLAVKLEDIKIKNLRVCQQLVTVEPTYKILKGHEERSVPHWFIKPIELYTIVQEIQIIHPDSVTELWGDLMKKLNMSYRFHDLKHRFVTNCWKLPNVKPRDIQTAAAHKSITTTMRYSHIDTTDNETFIARSELGTSLASIHRMKLCT